MTRGFSFVIPSSVKLRPPGHQAPVPPANDAQHALRQRLEDAVEDVFRAALQRDDLAAAQDLLGVLQSIHARGRVRFRANRQSTPLMIDRVRKRVRVTHGTTSRRPWMTSPYYETVEDLNVQSDRYIKIVLTIIAVCQLIRAIVKCRRSRLFSRQWHTAQIQPPRNWPPRPVGRLAGNRWRRSAAGRASGIIPCAATGPPQYRQAALEQTLVPLPCEVGCHSCLVPEARPAAASSSPRSPTFRGDESRPGQRSAPPWHRPDGPVCDPHLQRERQQLGDLVGGCRAEVGRVVWHIGRLSRSAEQSKNIRQSACADHDVWAASARQPASYSAVAALSIRRGIT